MARYELTDEQYALIAPELPTNDGKIGHPFDPHRPIINGIFWRLRTEAPWADIPQRYGYPSGEDRGDEGYRFEPWSVPLRYIGISSLRLSTPNGVNAVMNVSSVPQTVRRSSSGSMSSTIV